MSKLTLNALYSDYSLNAPQSPPKLAVTVLNVYYLTDPSGNRLKDQSGNYLVGYNSDLTYYTMLNAPASDWNLNAE